MTTPFLIYGATGFTGQLAAEEAVRQGLRPTLAGRSAARLAPLADRLGLDYLAFDLDDTATLDRALTDVPVVLHAAGPYVATARPMVDACLRTRTHYLDITGELPVFMAIAARDQEARARRVLLLPGMGFDVAPTDCLALYLKGRLPTATHLALAFRVVGGGGVSRGTARSALGMLPAGNKLRRDGQLVSVPFGAKTRQVDFGRGPVTAVLAPWGDVFTAYHSTGIPNIEDYMVLPGVSRWLRLLNPARPLLRQGLVQRWLSHAIDALPAGPGQERRARARTLVWGEVTDGQGQRAAARLYGPEPGYTWTPRIMTAGIRRVLAGEAPPGYQTPASAYGPDFILTTGDDVRREDVA